MFMLRFQKGLIMACKLPVLAPDYKFKLLLSRD